MGWARIEEAIKYYSMAVRVQPNNSEAYKNLGESLREARLTRQ